MSVDTSVNNDFNTNIEETPKKKGNIARRIIAGIVLLLLIGFAGLFVYEKYYSGPDEGALLENAVKAELGQLENKTVEEQEAELNRVVEEGTMAIAINMRPVFADGASEGSLQIENSPANHYGQEIIITLDETGEEIYRSGLLLPNYHIQSDKLAVDLDAGEYPCTATFVGYDLDIGNEPVEVGSAAASILITVIS